MIEKIDITDTSVINAITRQLNIKNIRNEMFPTWRLTLQPGEEYDNMIWVLLIMGHIW